MNRFIKKAAAAAMSLAMLASSSAAISAYAATNNTTVTLGYVTYKVYSDHAEVCGIDRNAVNVTIRETVNGKPVTQMAAVHTMSRPYLTNVTIKAKLNQLDFAQFANCMSLKKVILPPSIQTIRAQAFSCCTALEEIRIPYSVTSIQSKAFQACYSLDKVVFNRINTTLEADNVFPANCSATFYTPKNGNLFPTYIYEQLAAREFNITVYSLGDVCNTSGYGTGDYRVTQADSTKVLQAYVNGLAGNPMGLNEKQKVSADVDGDGEISAADAQYILTYTNAASAGYPFGMEAWMSGKLNGNF